ncbi:hypothetical protein [Listeria costaricensis]|uniref:hypothetical protein n=1 Tax=Listeria costaricensis TaxID=2026604 RepID=UPI000C084BEA|nr:hypothetical protein [Listeria costaricensis]
MIELGYGIDYEEEKDEYDIDHSGNVELIDGSTISFENVKANGFDWLAICLVDGAGEKYEIVSEELAWILYAAHL